MPGNPTMSIGAANMWSILTNTVVSTTLRRTSFRLTGVPTTFRRTFFTNRPHHHAVIRIEKWVRCMSSYNTQALASDAAVTSPSSSSVIGYPEYTRLLPCPSTNFSPRVEHLVVFEEISVCAYISRSLNLPPLYVADLIKFGAVFYALVCPVPPVTATDEQVRLYKQFTSPELLKHRLSFKGKTIREAQKSHRVASVDQIFEVGTYLRIHVHPKRFPRCYEIDWKSRILAVTDSYVVLDKPAGTSVGGSSDNIEESCATFATRALDLTSPLFTTHQIDNCTEGCVVLARTKEYCSVFHKKIRDKRVKKLYLGLAAAPVPCGKMTHYMRPDKLAPRIISEGYMEKWLLCQMEVLDCKEVPWPDSLIRERYHIEDFDWPAKNVAYECTINLLTGRTHQIRAQFAACGAPLVGDSMYMPASLAEVKCPEVNPFSSFIRDHTSEDDERIAIDKWISLHGKEPSVAIGLQACQISWDDGEHIYKPRSPWWR